MLFRYIYYTWTVLTQNGVQVSMLLFPDKRFKKIWDILNKMNASKKIIFIWFMRAVLKLSNKNIYIIQIKKYKKTENPERENYKKNPIRHFLLRPYSKNNHNMHFFPQQNHSYNWIIVFCILFSLLQISNSSVKLIICIIFITLSLTHFLCLYIIINS